MAALAVMLAGLSVACTPPTPPEGPPPEICHQATFPWWPLVDISWNGDWDGAIHVFFPETLNTACPGASGYRSAAVISVPWDGSADTYPAALATATELCHGEPATYVHGASYTPALPDSMWACLLY